MKRKKIIIRSHGDRLLVRFVVDETDKTVYVTDLQGITDIEQNGKTETLVGFKKRDTFVYIPGSEEFEGKVVDWNEYEGHFE